MGTSATGGDPAQECAANTPSCWDWEALVSENQAAYDSRYNSMGLELPFAEPDLPTDERIDAIRRGDTDPGMALLFFNMNRRARLESDHYKAKLVERRRKRRSIAPSGHLP